MAYAQVRYGKWWGVGFRFRDRPEFVYIGLSTDLAENGKIAKKRARDVTVKIALNTFDFAQEFPNAKSHLKRLGLLPAPVRQIPTLGEYASRLLANWPARDGKLTDDVLYDYGLLINGKLLPHKIAALHITDVCESDVRTFVRDLEAETTPHRVNYMRARLCTIFKTAVSDRLIAANDNPMIGIGKLREVEPEPDPFTLAEVPRLIAAAEGWHRVFLTIMLHRGLRPNEVLALYWRDIDWKMGTLTVRGTVHRGGKIGPPKTPGSVRTLVMGPAVTAALREQQPRSRFHRSGLVFPSANGTPMDLNNFRERD